MLFVQGRISLNYLPVVYRCVQGNIYMPCVLGVSLLAKRALSIKQEPMLFDAY